MGRIQMKLGLRQKKKEEPKQYVLKTTQIMPGDYIILKFPKYNMPYHAVSKYINDQVKKLKTKFPHNEIIALSDGIEMEILKQWP